MDQSQYWMLMKRRQLLMKSHFQVSVHSWEEKAFAEDKGCVWPPRSYGCSFCKREFRSAQALGGHMNVHRRDRARLKQSLICQNPNDSSPSSSSSRVSPHPQEAKRGSNNGVLNPNPEEMEDKRSCVGVETSLSVGLSSVFFPNRPACCGEEVINNYKRPKINGVSTVPFLVSKETYSVGFKPVAAGSMDELDLELRLGVLPKGHGSVKGVIDLLDVAKVTEDL